MLKQALVALALTACAEVALTQEFPLWERLLQHYSGKTDVTPVPSMTMGHMQMSTKRAPAPGDTERAGKILVAAASVVSHYADVNTAVHDGYRPFFPSGKMGEEVHYTNYRYRQKEQRQVDFNHPGSILFRRTAEGMKAVGVMYTAPADATADQLDEIVPLSIATWHRHVDFCAAPRNLSVKEQFGPGARFGPQGSIHTEDDCNTAHGLWIAVVFGWMTHVYPHEKEQWGGMDMHMEAGAPASEE